MRSDGARHWRGGHRRRTIAGLLTVGLLAAGPLLAGCGTGGVPSDARTPAGRGTAATDSPFASTPPASTPSASTPSASPLPSSPLPSSAASDSTTIGGSPSPTDRADGSSPSEPEASTSPPTDTPASGSLAGCAGATVTRVAQVEVQPRRTTEVVTVVSDGRTLTSGTRTQTEFVAPSLQNESGAELSDPALVTRAVSLVAADGKSRVLVRRPPAPDTGLSANRRPFGSPGTYVLFNASARLRATVLASCDGQEQRWSLAAEAEPASGQLNCAVEPAKTDALAHAVYLGNCD